MSRGTLGVGVFVCLALIGVIVLSGMAVGTAGASEDTQNTSLGAEISSFMQASSVEATDDVEEGTFEAALNRTEDPDERRALIEGRQQRLQERSEQLQIQQEGLGNASDVRNRSIATRISVGAIGLERSANRTEKAATAAGVDAESLAEIRSNARTLRGSKVSELARSVAGPSGGGPPGETQPGPPGTNQSGSLSDHPPASSDSTGDAALSFPMDARDAERGSPDTDPGDRSAANSSNSIDDPGGNGTQLGDDNPAHDRGGEPDNNTGSDGSFPDRVPGAENGDRGPPGEAGNASTVPPEDWTP